MKYIFSYIVAFAVLSGWFEIAAGQSASTSSKFIMKNAAGNTITLAPPSSGVTNYSLTFPPATGGAGSFLYASDALGTLGWISAGTAGQVLSVSALGIPTWITPILGSVASVGLSMPSGFSVSNSPVTSIGTLTVTTSLNGPIRGTGTGFTTGNINLSSEVTGTLGAANGGTGQTTYTTGDILYASAANTLSKLSIGSAGKVLTVSGGIPAWVSVPTGSVTSVGLTMPAVLYSSVSGSPVTSSGTLIPQLATQTANTVFAGPVSGGSATPIFRSLVAADIPSGSGNYIQNGTSPQTANFNITGNGQIAGQLQLKGTGSGITTFQADGQGSTNINYTLPTAQGAANTYLRNDGSGVLSWVAPSSQIGAVQFAIKGSDETVTNSSTLQNDNDLSFSIGANETWELVAQLDADENNDNNNIKMKVAVTIPSGTLHVYAWVADNDGDGDDGNWLTTSGNSPGSYELNGNDEFGPVMLQGMIAGGSTGGTIHIQWAPSTSSSSSVTVHANSYLKVTRAQ